MRRSALSILVITALAGGLACGAGTDPGPGPGPGPSRRAVPPPSTSPTPDNDTDTGTGTAAPVITEFGAGAAKVGAVSSGAMERDSGFDFDLRPMNQYCSVAFDADDGIGVVTNDETLVLAMIIEDPEKRTYGGVGVGSTTDEVVAQFGANATVLDVVSEAGGPLIQIAPAGGPSDTARGIYFRTDRSGVVTQYRIGMWPWVQYEQYCGPSAAQG